MRHRYGAISLPCNISPSAGRLSALKKNNARRRQGCSQQPCEEAQYPPERQKAHTHPVRAGQRRCSDQWKNGAVSDTTAAVCYRMAVAVLASRASSTGFASSGFRLTLLSLGITRIRVTSQWILTMLSDSRREDCLFSEMRNNGIDNSRKKRHYASSLSGKVSG